MERVDRGKEGKREKVVEIGTLSFGLWGGEPAFTFGGELRRGNRIGGGIMSSEDVTVAGLSVDRQGWQKTNWNEVGIWPVLFLLSSVIVLPPCLLPSPSSSSITRSIIRTCINSASESGALHKHIVKQVRTDMSGTCCRFFPMQEILDAGGECARICHDRWQISTRRSHGFSFLGNPQICVLEMKASSKV